eukprot:jgi/Tetstr1/455146/TSEL_041996.t1
MATTGSPNSHDAASPDSQGSTEVREVSKRSGKPKGSDVIKRSLSTHPGRQNSVVSPGPLEPSRLHDKENSYAARIEGVVFTGKKDGKWFPLFEKALASLDMVEALHEEVGTLKDEVNGLKDENNDLKGEVMNLRGEVQGLKGEVQGLKAENESLRNEVQGLKAENEGLKDEVQGLEGEIQGLKAENEGLKAENESLRGEVQGLKAENEGLKGEVKGLKGEVQGLKAENESLRGEVQGLKAENEGLRAENEGLRAEVEGLKIDNRSLQVRVETLERWMVQNITARGDSLQVQRLASVGIAADPTAPAGLAAFDIAEENHQTQLRLSNNQGGEAPQLPGWMGS